MSEFGQIPKPTKYMKYRLPGQVQVRQAQALSSLELCHLFQLLLLRWGTSETHAWGEHRVGAEVLKCWTVGYS